LINRNTILLFIFLFSSCRAYRHNVILQLDEDRFPYGLEYQKELAEKNYIIQINDILKIDVFTNEGERIIDPNFELRIMGVGNTNTVYRPDPNYIVQKDGNVKIPMVGLIQLVDMTIREAESELENQFSRFYKNPYVIVEFANKRVTVLGAPGGQVIPLLNEDMNLLEVLALAGGLDIDAKGENVRVIRGDLKNPEVRIIDLSTVDGMMQADMRIYPGDIVYIEPVRKPLVESTRDLASILALIASFSAMIIAIKAL
jgi:polysaccharide export outer membrane protein